MQKHLLKIFFISYGLILTTSSMVAQINFVPNPSFEQDTACPSNLAQLYKLKNWFKTNGTPDYFNKCYNGAFNYASIPNNSLGYQNISVNCYSYIGGLSYWPYNVNTETAATKLTDSLIIGKKYYFSCKISLANSSKHATNNFGALFTHYLPPTYSVSVPNNFSQIKFNQISTDTLNWTKLFKSFVADSNYKYISIGNFYDSTNTSKIIVNSTGSAGAYYYIDDVCISDDSTFTYNYIYNCSGLNVSEISLFSKVKFSPNPANTVIEVSTYEKGCYLTIYDSSGREIFNSDLLTEIQQVNISGINNGFYTIKIFDRSKKIITSQKLIILNP